MFEKNLKFYRLKNNMTKKELAAACGITAMAITNYEKGTRRPDMETIIKMASVLNVHVSDFITQRNASLSFQHAEFRKTTSMSKAQQEYVREYVEDYFSRFFNAIECLGGNPLPDPPKGRVLTATGDEEVDAKSLRNYLGLSLSGPIGELTTFLENIGIFVLEIVLDNNSFSGMNGTVNGYPYIVVNSAMNQERKRSTISHELAHIFFDNISESKEDEKNATAVSGAFLINKEDLFRELGFRRKRITNDMLMICKEYGISMWMLVLRASKSGIIPQTVAQDFYIKASKAGWKTNEPSRIKEEPPRLFRQLVYRAINEEDISIHKGAELLQIPYSEVLKESGLLEVTE